MLPTITPEPPVERHALRSFFVIAAALAGAALVVVLLAGTRSTEVAGTQTPASAAAASADDAGSGSTDPDLDGAFDPVDAQPAPTLPPTPSWIPPPPPAATPSAPPPPGPPTLGMSNECPNFQITTPAMIVWGLEDHGSWLNARADATRSAPVVRTFPGDALTQTITGGCKPDEDGTPWLEYLGSDGSLAYASAEYLRPAGLVCLRGRVEGRSHPDAEPDTWFEGPLDGHGFSDGGPFAAFIRNGDIGVSNTYRLVPTNSLTFAGNCRS